MAERKTLTITQVNEVQKVGDKQIPKLSFRIEGGEEKHSYFTFRPRLFELIKEGQTIEADIETEIRGEYTNHKVVQIYVDGQPIAGKGTGPYRGKSPEELELSAKSYALAYAKDLAVAQVIPLENITKQADIFYDWIKGNGDKPASPAKRKETTTEEREFESLDKPDPAQPEPSLQTTKKNPPTGKKVQNIAELKSLLMKHKIGTHEAYEILSIKQFDELKDLDKAWADIKKAKGIE